MSDLSAALAARIWPDPPIPVCPHGCCPTEVCAWAQDCPHQEVAS